MSVRLLDDARAFEIIAPHLTEERRQEVAEAIAARIAKGTGNRAPTPSSPAVSAERPEYLLAEGDPVVSYLNRLGYREGELTRAAGRLASAVRRHWAKDEPPPESVIAALWDQITAEAKP